MTRIIVSTGGKRGWCYPTASGERPIQCLTSEAVQRGYVSCDLSYPGLESGGVTRYSVTRYAKETLMAQAAERMRAMRERRRAKGLRELRLIVPDPHARAVLRRVAKQVASLDQSAEREAMRWIEAVAEFDAP